LKKEDLEEGKLQVDMARNILEKGFKLDPNNKHLITLEKDLVNIEKMIR